MAKRRDLNPLIPLEDAVWHFAPRKLRAMLGDIQSLPTNKYRHHKSDDPAEHFKILMEAFKNTVDHIEVRNKPIWKMQKYLIRRLATGTLEALGIRTKPEFRQEKESIASHFFEGSPTISWAKNSLESLGRKFELIVVRRRPPEATARTPLQAKTNLQPKPSGRPRVDDEISEVARELASRQSFEGKSEKSRVAVVQAECHRRFPRLFPKASQPSPTKIREILKRLGV